MTMLSTENGSPRELPIQSSLTISLLVLVALFIFLGLRGLVFPLAGSGSLGIEIHNLKDLALMQTTAARNLGIALAALLMIVFDTRKALGLLLLAAAAITVLDFVIVAQASSWSQAVKHGGYFILLGGFAWATLRGAR